MKKLFTICFLLIASLILSQNKTIDSLQQRVSQVSGSEKTVELNTRAKLKLNTKPKKKTNKLNYRKLQ